MMIYLLGYRASKASCMLHVGRFLAYSSNLEVQEMRYAKMFISIHDTASKTQKLVLYVVIMIYILSVFYLTMHSVTEII
jgi:hypothetical protein